MRRSELDSRCRGGHHGHVRRALAIGGVAALGVALGGALYVDGRRVMRETPPTASGVESNPRPAGSAQAGVLGREGASPSDKSAPPSRCFGRVNHGSLENGWQLPREGPNFQAYSGLGWSMGRTHVHSKVWEVVLDAYEVLARSHPELQFVYGETGHKDGGRFRPHRTHQTGTSVDFMVPVRDGDGSPTVLPTGPTNKWGYAIDFDERGRWKDLVIDLEAVSVHLAALKRTAAASGVPITKVVFYPPLRQRLAKTKAWPEIAGLPFTKKEAWVRHDDHYHVDFGVACGPLAP